MDDRIKNIQKHEATLDKGQELVERLDALLAEWERYHPDFKALMTYYGSAQWHEDVQACDEGAFNDIQRGVLSEDGVFDLYGEQRGLNLKMIRTSIDYLEG